MKIYPSDILLPDFGNVSGTLWACVACDQYTSEPEYWERVSAVTRSVPTTLELMLPEVWLAESEKRVPTIHAAMEKYINDGVLITHTECGVYIERVQSDGKLRRGLVCAIDLEDYDYSDDSASAIRPTEKTVVERIPPRLAVRRGASLEMPHVMLLVDDPDNILLSRFVGREADAYEFDLMEGGGSVRASFVKAEEFEELNAVLEVLGECAKRRAEKNGKTEIVIAVGDGNHSLATARASWYEVKKTLSDEELETHPARYALVEIVNLHDTSLEFEPIYRIVETPDAEELLRDFKEYAANVHGGGSAQSFDVIVEGKRSHTVIKNSEYTLPVASLQHFLDEWIKGRSDCVVDYIHGEDTLCRLAGRKNIVGFLFEGMKKSDLFFAVECDGALPRKTFSMGHAADKRYYIECRKILGGQ